MELQQIYQAQRAYWLNPDAQFGWDTDRQRCVYRTPEGNGCNVGILMPQALYDPAFDGQGNMYGPSFGVVNKELLGHSVNGNGTLAEFFGIDLERTLRNDAFGDHDDLDPKYEYLRKSQIIHDRLAEESAPHEIRPCDTDLVQQLDELAKEFGLEVPTKVTVTLWASSYDDANRKLADGTAKFVD